MQAEADLPLLKWVSADEQGVVDFPVSEKNFSSYQQSHKHAYNDACCCAEAEVLAEADLPSLKWVPADKQGVVDFLVAAKNFSEGRLDRRLTCWYQ